MIAALVDQGILPQTDLSSLSDLYPYVPDVAALQSGALTNDAMATLVATESANALTAESGRLDEPAGGGTQPVSYPAPRPDSPTFFRCSFPCDTDFVEYTAYADSRGQASGAIGEATGLSAYADNQLRARKAFKPH